MIEIAFILALSILFLNKVTEEGMILQIVRTGLWDLPNWIKKPLFDCPVCMVPWWGSFILLTGFLFDTWDLPTTFEWIMILAIAGGINTVLSSFLVESDNDNENE